MLGLKTKWNSNCCPLKISIMGDPIWKNLLNEGISDDGFNLMMISVKIVVLVGTHNIEDKVQ